MTERYSDREKPTSIVVGDALFAHFCKHAEKIRESEHFLHARAQVDEPQFASGSLARHINPHQRSQAHAVNPLKFSKVQHDQFALRFEPTDLVAEKAADAGNEPASAMYDCISAPFRSTSTVREMGVAWVGMGSTFRADRLKAERLMSFCQ